MPSRGNSPLTVSQPLQEETKVRAKLRRQCGCTAHAILSQTPPPRMQNVFEETSVHNSSICVSSIHYPALLPHAHRLEVMPLPKGVFTGWQAAGCKPERRLPWRAQRIFQLPAVLDLAAVTDGEKDNVNSPCFDRYSFGHITRTAPCRLTCSLGP